MKKTHTKFTEQLSRALCEMFNVVVFCLFFFVSNIKLFSGQNQTYILWWNLISANHEGGGVNHNVWYFKFSVWIFHEFYILIDLCIIDIFIFMKYACAINDFHSNARRRFIRTQIGIFIKHWIFWYSIEQMSMSHRFHWFDSPKPNEWENIQKFHWIFI